MIWSSASLVRTRLARSGSGLAGRLGGATSRERGREREKRRETDEQEKHHLVASHTHLNWGPGPKPRMGSTMSSSLGKPAATPVSQIQETISDNCVVIFSKTSCSYCTMAKKLFQDMNVNYKVVELDMLEYGSQFQDALYQMTGERTVPRIFVNGTFIGGATDTHRLHQEGKLLPLVHQCYLKKK